MTQRQNCSNGGVEAISTGNFRFAFITHPLSNVRRWRAAIMPRPEADALAKASGMAEFHPLRVGTVTGSSRATMAGGTDAKLKGASRNNLTVAAWLSAAIIAFCLIAVAGGFLMGAGII